MRAYEADPYLTNANVTVYRLFLASYQLDDPVEAKHWCEEGQRRFPNDYRFADCQLTYYSMKGATQNIPEGWRMVDRYVELGPPSLRDLNRLLGQMRMAVALGRAGLVDSARRVAERSGPTRPWTPVAKWPSLRRWLDWSLAIRTRPSSSSQYLSRATPRSSKRWIRTIAGSSESSGATPGSSRS